MLYLNIIKYQQNFYPLTEYTSQSAKSSSYLPVKNVLDSSVLLLNNGAPKLVPRDKKHLIPFFEILISLTSPFPPNVGPNLKQCSQVLVSSIGNNYYFFVKENKKQFLFPEQLHYCQEDVHEFAAQPPNILLLYVFATNNVGPLLSHNS
eukprot:TRINITY_DN19754_c0_g1_i1.p3 TRINITY_DN19754_c0_g1~~TRINITY_DN19754_c0_g1_i1.p3  ORF type:complete len:149 (-),score=11.12 TRINITY_DN19754_c0_g1_i1:149-595(-)